MIKMIVMDLDNTLLTSHKHITDYSLNVLHKCRREGFKLVIATARSEKAALPYQKILQPDISIYNNGALVKCKNIIIFEETIPNSACCDLLNVCTNQYKLENTKVVTKYGDFSNAKNIRGDGFEYEFNDYSNLKDNVYKITIKTDESIAYQIVDQYANYSVFKFEGRNSFMFTHVNATKETAVKKIADWCGLNMDEIIAFGDDLGDIGMLVACGIGIAVANAEQKVKAAANSICGSNDEDGVAKWIIENIFL